MRNEVNARNTRLWIAGLAAAVFYGMQHSTAKAAGLEIIEPPAGKAHCGVTVCSADGTVLGGNAFDVNSGYDSSVKPFRWRSDTGSSLCWLVGLDGDQGWCWMLAMSPDGSLVGGCNGGWNLWYRYVSDPQVHEWHTYSAVIDDFTADNSLAAGESQKDGMWQATIFHLAQTNRTILPMKPTHNYSYAYALSDDGRAAFGFSQGDKRVPARWTIPLEGTNSVIYDELPPGYTRGEYEGCNADGTVAVGTCESNGVYYPMTWSVSGGMRAYPGWRGGYLCGRVSSLGSAVGYADKDSGLCAIYYSPAHGVQNLAVVAQSVWGIDLGNWLLWQANDMSEDGRVIVGYAKNLSSGVWRGFRLTLPDTAFDTLAMNRDEEGNRLVLSWAGPGWRLQSTTNLVSGTWTDRATGTNRFELTPQGHQAEFFRIYSP